MDLNLHIFPFANFVEAIFPFCCSLVLCFFMSFAQTKNAFANKFLRFFLPSPSPSICVSYLAHFAN